jgi:hypothetical protein
MLNPTHMFRSGVQVLTDNAPAILTAFGAVGAVGTAVLAGKASYEACGKVRNEIDSRFEEARTDPTVETELTRTEIIKIVWPLYVPAVTTGTVTVAAILMSHRISSKRAAALAAAYALNQDKLEEYQDKVKEKLGVKKEKEARTELTQERINRDWNENSEMVVDANDGKVWLREDYTGRFFKGTIEDIKHAVNEVNHTILSERSVRMSDFYDLIGLSHVSTSDYFGWTANERLEIEWDTCTTPDGKIAVHSFEYVNHPVMNPEREATFH